MSKNICVVTGTRAEYGLLRWVIENIKDDADLNLQIIATGMHLSPEFGLTYKEIEDDGFYIDRKVEMQMSSDTPLGITKSMGLGMIGFADALNELQPDILVVLGDRYEIFSAVCAALVACIPVAHLHGGETTEGAFDEAIRHSITKMAHLHFVAAEYYRRRVIQLGEDTRNVFLVGGLGIDSINNMELLNRKELECELGFEFSERNLLITFHPVTLERASSASQMSELLSALAPMKSTRLIFTMPNSDTDSRILFKMINQFVAENDNAYVFTSLGHLRYLSCIAQVDGVLGNSSSGLLEVPSFNKATVNIGERQRGRLQAESVINCDPICKSISDTIDVMYSKIFQDKLKNITSPYGTGGASKKVVEIIKASDTRKIVKKTFYNLPKTCFLDEK